MWQKGQEIEEAGKKKREENREKKKKTNRQIICYGGGDWDKNENNEPIYIAAYSLRSAFTCNHWYCLYKDLQGSQKLNGMPQVTQLVRKIVHVFWLQI